MWIRQVWVRGNGPYFIATKANYEITTKMVKSNVVEPELSYSIVGVGLKVFKELGFGYQEKYYQRAFEIELKKNRITYAKENLAELKYRGQNIGNYRLDFLVENRIIVEIKVGDCLHYKDFNQVKAYLKKTEIKLGIIILFSPAKVKFEKGIATKQKL